MNGDLDVLVGLTILLGIPASWILMAITVFLSIFGFFSPVICVVLILISFAVWFPINIILGLCLLAALTQ